MKIAVANTDIKWFRFLRDLAVARSADGNALDEVNFWRPSSGQAFRMLQPGEPFLFRLKAPRSVIAGGGFFLGFQRLPLKLAWDAFTQANGANDVLTLRRMIAVYRSGTAVTDYGTRIGCILITQPVFFPEAAWIPTPPDWSPNIVAYKGYDTNEPIGHDLWDRVKPLMSGLMTPEDRVGEFTLDIDEMFGPARPVRPRLGQGSFRTMVTENYEYRCAVTAGKILPVLEAAHIRPVGARGGHDVRNGILLRSDVHTLFDRGFVTITPDLVFRTSSALRDEFHNGEEYRRLEGAQVWVPPRSELAPDRTLLEWHADAVFVP